MVIIMIKKIQIKNFLLLKDIKLDFSNQFNVIIGESGSGKTLILTAIDIILGNNSIKQKKDIKEMKARMQYIHQITSQ